MKFNSIKIEESKYSELVSEVVWRTDERVVTDEHDILYNATQFVIKELSKKFADYKVKPVVSDNPDFIEFQQNIKLWDQLKSINLNVISASHKTDLHDWFGEPHEGVFVVNDHTDTDIYNTEFDIVIHYDYNSLLDFMSEERLEEFDPHLQCDDEYLFAHCNYNA